MRVNERRQTGGWLVVVIAGLAVVVAGVLALSFEREYGSGLNFSVVTGQDGDAVVHEIDADDGTERVVFEGSEEAAHEYVEERRDAAERPLLPTVGIIAGIVVVGVGLQRRHAQSR